LVYPWGIISISWGINAPEDGGLSRLPHIIEKVLRGKVEGESVDIAKPNRLDATKIVAPVSESVLSGTYVSRAALEVGSM